MPAVDPTNYCSGVVYWPPRRWPLGTGVCRYKRGGWPILTPRRGDGSGSTDSNGSDSVQHVAPLTGAREQGRRPHVATAARRETLRG
jgi:hypothetical protein